MINLQQGDCLELMKGIPDKSIDLLLTDPPYNISKNNNFKTMKRSGIDFGGWDHKFDLINWLSGISRIMNDGSSVIIFNDWRNLGVLDNKLNDEGFIGKDIFRWIKSNPMPRNRNRRYITDFEVALIATSKKGKWVFNRLNSTYERPEFTCPIVSGNKRFHPTQKPVSLMEHLILRHSNANQTILDPFMGSGSTGVACVNTSRNFIGMELDPKYFEIAKNRINSEREDELKFRVKMPLGKINYETYLNQGKLNKDIFLDTPNEIGEVQTIFTKSEYDKLQRYHDWLPKFDEKDPHFEFLEEEK